MIAEDVRRTVRKLADLGLVAEEAPQETTRKGADAAGAAPPSCWAPACPGWGRAHRPLQPTTSPDEVAAAVGATARSSSSACADAAQLDRIEAELRPYLEATPTGPDDFSGTRRAARVAHRPLAGLPRAGQHPLALGTARGVPRARHEHPAAPDPGHRHRPGRDGAADPPRPVGLRLLPLPPGLRGPVQHDLGADRLHRGQRGHPGGRREQPRPGRTRRSDPTTPNPPRWARLGAVLFGQRVPRRRRQRSDATRIGLNITYNVAWLRQEENQYLSVPREVAETLPTELLRLMGYDRGAYALGYIDDLRDPIEAVRPGIGRRASARTRRTCGRKSARRRLMQPRAISRSQWAPLPWCRAGRDPRRRPTTMTNSSSRSAASSRGRGVPAGPAAHPRRVRRLLDRALLGGLGGPVRGLPDRCLLHQAELRRAGRPHRQRRLLRPRRLPGHGRRARPRRALAAEARRLGFDAMQFNLVFESNPARADVRASSASKRSAAIPGPSTARTP